MGGIKHYLSPLSLIALGIVILFVDHFGLLLAPISTLKRSTQTQHYSATLLEAPEHNGNKTKLLARLDSTGKKVILSGKHLPELHYGQKIRFTGQFRELRPPSNPGQLDYQKYLHRKGIMGLMSIRQITDVQDTWVNPFKWLAIKARPLFHNVFHNTVPAPYDVLLIGLVFGDHGVELSDELQEKFRHVGLTHLLVVSGSQVSLLSGVVLNALRSLQLRRITIMILVWAVNAVFYFMTGGGASIFRAVLMNSVATGLWAIKRQSTPLHVCSFTALLMLMINPNYLLDLGAILSFLATFSLIYGVPHVEKQLPRGWPKVFKTSFSTALAPFIWTTPITAYFFHAISPISLISNMIAVQAIEWLVVVGFASAFIGIAYEPIALIMNNFCLIIMQGLTLIVDLLAAIPGGQFYVSDVPAWLLTTGYAYLVCIAFPLPFKVPKKIKNSLLIATLLGITSTLVITHWPHPWMTVTYLDVGQGDATLIQTPNNKTILIDAGNRIMDWKTKTITSDMGKRVILPTFRSLGINKLDVAVVTHFDSDHVGGMDSVLSTIPVGTLIDNGRHEEAFFNYYDQQQQQHHIIAQAGQRIILDHNIHMDILYPMAKQLSDEDKNNNSVTIRLIYENTCYLFTGDLEAEGETNLVHYYGDQLDCDILKLGHHGSNTSTTPQFLKRVSPKIGVVSAGYKNRYHHPHPSVMSRLKRAGIQVYRTDLDGAIQIQSNGKQFRVKKHLIKAKP